MMFKFKKELVFYDEKIAPVCIAADLLGFISMGVYMLFNEFLSPDIAAILNKATTVFIDTAFLLSAVFFFVWGWVKSAMWRYSIVRSKKVLIIFTHILNLIYDIILVESDSFRYYFVLTKEI